MSSRRRETLDQFTERAIRATDAGKLIPPIVYLPSRLRANNTRLTADQLRITVEPPTVAENQVRIQEADPVGFLTAIMHGQPIPRFSITKEGAVLVTYIVPDLKQSIAAAEFMAHKVTLRTRDAYERKGKLPEEDWDDIVRKRTEGERNAAG